MGKTLLSVENFVFSSRETKGRQLLFFPLMFLSFLYKQVVIFRLKAYQKGLFYSQKIPIPVISVGNLAVGGTGKTPTTIYLARLLKNQGKRVAVLSRGYKGSASLKVNVVSDGQRLLLSPEKAGDEPLLIAKKLPGVPVLTGKDRRFTGEYARQNFSIEAAILDDGFQHLRLKRDLDILLLDGDSPFGNGYLLPRGSLREPPEHLKRADLIMVTQADKVNDPEALKGKIRLYNHSAPIFFARYVPVVIERLNRKEKVSLDFLQGQKVIALAGIANPETFFTLLISLGAKVTETLFYPDHHSYQSANLDKGEQGLPIVTTEKDAVKLRRFAPLTREVLVLGIELRIEKEAEFQKVIRNYLPSLF